MTTLHFISWQRHSFWQFHCSPTSRWSRHSSALPHQMYFYHDILHHQRFLLCIFPLVPAQAIMSSEYLRMLFFLPCFWTLAPDSPGDSLHLPRPLLWAKQSSRACVWSTQSTHMKQRTAKLSRWSKIKLTSRAFTWQRLGSAPAIQVFTLSRVVTTFAWCGHCLKTKSQSLLPHSLVYCFLRVR